MKRPWPLAVLVLSCGPAPTSPNPPSTVTPPDPRPRALVYRGPGACPGCPEALGAVLDAAGLQTSYAGPDELVLDGAFDGIALYAQPGGDDTVQVYEAMGAAGFASFSARMSAWIAGGGRYLGVCLGGFLAGQWIDDAATIPALRLFPGDAQYFTATPLPSVRDQVIPVTWYAPAPTPRFVYFQDGPMFVFKQDAGVATDGGANVDGGVADAGASDAGARSADSTIWARYHDGSPAAAVVRRGAGKVGLCGFHFEADASWYRLYHLSDPDGLDQDLGLQLIGDLMAR